MRYSKVMLDETDDIFLKDKDISQFKGEVINLWLLIISTEINQCHHIIKVLSR